MTVAAAGALTLLDGRAVPGMVAVAVVIGGFEFSIVVRSRSPASSSPAARPAAWRC